jgi:hypothetical protein
MSRARMSRSTIVLPPAGSIGSGRWRPISSSGHQTDGQVLGTNLNSSESTRRFWRSRL